MGKLPTRTTHHTFLEGIHPWVTKNPYYVFSPEGSQQKRVSAHGLIGIQLNSVELNLRKSYFQSNMEILAATDPSILTSCWDSTLDTCATTGKLETEAFVLECQKLAYNWRTPSKLSFKRGYVQSDISISSATDLHPFWPNFRMVLSIRMPLVIYP